MWEVRKKRRDLTEKVERKEKNPFQRSQHTVQVPHCDMLGRLCSYVPGLRNPPVPGSGSVYFCFLVSQEPSGCLC